MAELPTTQWSLLQRCGLHDTHGRGAWSALITAYRPVVLVFFRRSPLAAEADDLTQAFLTRSLEQDWWRRADPQRGSFRGFLYTLLRRFLGHEMARRQAVPLTGVESHPVDTSPAMDRAVDLAFLARLSASALERLRGDYGRRRRLALFDALAGWLQEPPGHGDLAELAERLGLPANTVSVEWKRLRGRFAASLRECLVDLCADAAQAEQEWQALRELLRS